MVIAKHLVNQFLQAEYSKAERDEHNEHFSNIWLCTLAISFTPVLEMQEYFQVGADTNYYL